MKPTKGNAKEVGENIIQKSDRELYLMARDVSLLKNPSVLWVILAYSWSKYYNIHWLEQHMIIVNLLKNIGNMVVTVVYKQN